MSIPLFLCFVQPSFAQGNSTILEGWQMEDNSRSSWDILWTCLVTIFACTWTALHPQVPPYGSSGVLIKHLIWIGAILAPELMTFTAMQEFWEVRSIVARCNAAQATAIESSPERTKPPAEVQTRQVQAPWTFLQGFCIRMRGLVLQTRDDWVYPVRPATVVPLIQAGIIKQTDLRAWEIEDRAKADSLAKAFTVLQSLWVICDVIGRAAYRLPVTPLEISTVAYVVCAVIAYASWWHKPKDMNTPIVIHLPYALDGDEIPLHIRNILEIEEKLRFHLAQDGSAESERAQDGKEEEPNGVLPFLVWVCKHPSKRWKVFKRKFKNRHHPGSPTAEATKASPSADPDMEASGTYSPTDNVGKSGVSGPTNSFQESLKVGQQLALDMLTFIIALVFCGVHVAAWNFTFPTMAEKTAWRVFSIIAFGICWPVIIFGELPLFRMWCTYGAASQVAPGAMGLKPLVRSGVLISLFIYAVARLGNIILMLISLRALPAGSYISVDWLATIPHI
ncbi:unnamed protein product [Penicillium egyptiacum]|uniref:Uncharacterized protein n=1 Tax=Penicillium egyptiacum TaxID=1303716 RepID=A0A9W4K8D2_9EURO|nr:unnamed protein product [Penicillium egyptiacum]